VRPCGVAGAAFARDELTVEDQFMAAKRPGRTACSGIRALISRPLQLGTVAETSIVMIIRQPSNFWLALSPAATGAPPRARDMSIGGKTGQATYSSSVVTHAAEVNLFPLFKLEAGRGPAPAG
jgi:hypothetical protein